MSAEPYSASLVSRFAVPGTHPVPQGYYRSKLFINSSTTNPLVAAAGPLFSLLERLSASPTLPPINNIRENIEHEVHAFHSRLAGQNYANEFVVIACYLLSATIDEILGKNYVRVQGKPAEFKAFTPSSLNELGPERRFFEILHFIKERTNQYLDLIELSYYCLIAGFEGEHHLRADGRQTLDNLIDELYQLIQQNRANKPNRLFKERTTTAPEPRDYRPLVYSTLIAIGVLLAIYFAGDALLEYKAKTLLFNNKSLMTRDH